MHAVWLLDVAPIIAAQRLLPGKVKTCLAMSFHSQTAGRRTLVDKTTVVFLLTRTTVSKIHSPDLVAFLIFKIGQGGTLSAFINRKTEFIKNQPPWQYNIAFTNAGNIKYCFDAGANTCNSDPNQFIGKAVAPNGGKWVTPFRRREELVPTTFNQYMSKRGELVTSARRMSTGEKLYHAKMDPVMEAAALENPDEDARNAFFTNPDNYEIVEDEVERTVTREEAATLA